MEFESDPFPPFLSPQAVIQKLEYQIKDWERDLTERPNPMLDPTIRRIIEDIRETIHMLQEGFDES